MFTLLLIAVIVAGTAYGFSSHRTETHQPVCNFQLDRYLGRWYEIARFDHRFERGLDYVTAEYILNDDGTVKVINRGYDRRHGRLHESNGKAKTTSVPGHLRVSFFLFFYSDYDILALGNDYDWALIGSRSPRYLWIMSRTPTLPPERMSQILETARQLGYDTSKLIMPIQTPQKENSEITHRQAVLQ
ncbi:MAG: lipocalin family protein [Alistipes sp.]|nr:lipocalin family protein [Alistipes sp.]